MATNENSEALFPPPLQSLRAILFWDTDMRKIDWNEKYKAVIRRVFERGDEAEQEAVTRFYGAEKVHEALSTNRTKPMTLRKLHNKH